MRKKTKHCWIYLPDYEVRAFETYMEEMALKGWYPEFGGLMNTYRFRPGEPKKCRFCAVLLNHSSVFDSDSGGGSPELRREFEEKGWVFLCADSIRMIFFTEDLEAVPPSAGSYEDQFYNSLWRKALFSAFPSNLMLTAVFLLDISLLLKSPYTFSSPQSLAVIPLLLYAICFFSLEACFAFLLYRSVKKKIRYGTEIRFRKLSTIRKMNLVQNIGFLTTLAVFLFFNLQPATFLIIAAAILGVVVAMLIFRIFKNSDESRFTKVVKYLVFSVLFLSCINIMAANFSRKLNFLQWNPPSSAASDPVPISFETLGYDRIPEEEDGGSKNEHTFLASYKTTVEQSEGSEIILEYYSSPLPSLVDQMEKKKLAFLDRYWDGENETITLSGYSDIQILCRKEQRNSEYDAPSTVSVFMFRTNSVFLYTTIYGTVPDSFLESAAGQLSLLSETL